MGAAGRTNSPLEYSSETRKTTLSALKQGQQFDAIVIGGGITGSGTANALSATGAKILLLERGDFASGTSSASSKLIHGGLRYLQQGRIFLTRDLIREREYLLRNTNIVRRIDFRILIDDYSASRTAVRFGLFLYSLLAGRPHIPKFIRNRGEYPAGIRGYFEFYDAVTDDSTLVVHNILSAVMKGSVCLNYCEVTGISAGSITEVHFTDRVSGNAFSVAGKVVVNCAGPWADSMLEIAGKPSNGARLSGGSHIVVDISHYKGMQALAFFSHIDGRQMFIIPRESVLIIGTTDSIVHSAEMRKPTPEEIDYILESARRIIPSINRDSILTSFYGVRPLLGMGNDPGKITRNFSILQEGNILSVYGVKLTDFRTASKKVADRGARILGKKAPGNDEPVINYRRPADPKIGYYVKHECPVTIEDITRRRFPVDIYSPSSRENVIAQCKEFVQNGLLLPEPIE